MYKRIKTYLLQLFCRHQYEIGVIMGLGIHMHSSLPATAVDGAEIVCFCSKCHKRFISVIADSKFNLKYK